MWKTLKIQKKKKIKVPKKNPKLQERCHFKKNSKFKREIQNSRERMTLKKKIKNFKNSREISKENDDFFFFPKIDGFVWRISYMMLIS